MFCRSTLFYITLGFALFNIGCAGPTTPFGPIHTLESVKKVEPVKTQKASIGNQHFLPSLRVSPDRQVLHDRTDITVAIRDQQGISSHSRLKVSFNGTEIENPAPFLKPPGESRKAFVALRDIYLRPDKKNEVTFYYQRDSRTPAVKYQLAQPECSLVENWRVKDLAPYRVSKELKSEVLLQSQEQGINPALLFGLIAQESGFNPRAISWAKALGLTQVTPIGDAQLAKRFPDWPRSEDIKKYPSGVLKVMIESGKITNDWRLDPKLSITGGIELLKEMNSYWQNKELPLVLSPGDKTPEEIDLTLASYNSGALRVYEAMQEKGLSYMSHKDLKEAKKYVNRVKSFCYHFSSPFSTEVAKQ